MGCPLNHDIIVVDDNYTGESISSHKKMAKKTENILKQYVFILKRLTEEGISGQTGDRLLEFAQMAEFLLKGIMEDTTELLTEQMEQYISEIDQADEEIY